jgi:hypothetical protein
MSVGKDDIFSLESIGLTNLNVLKIKHSDWCRLLFCEYYAIIKYIFVEFNFHNNL